MQRNQNVHCRIGSLENLEDALRLNPLVHCRIGSLEIALTTTV
ncbi:hypothetical protein PEC301296_31370 [Pectobacterium carotovorum subsp. carotovorum]|nr:hypothetical protein PEC301296_31370 [Pectobacterium carotovorum subsp. carotovorum]